MTAGSDLSGPTVECIALNHVRGGGLEGGVRVHSLRLRCLDAVLGAEHD